MKSLSTLLSLFLLTAMSAFAQSPVSFEIQGHRGARGLMPENTLPAFFRAIDLGVQTLEMDVVITKDRQVVVSHEPYFNPKISTDPNGQPVTPATQGNIYEMTYRQVKKYDVGERGNPDFPEQQPVKAYKPLLKKVLKECERYARKKGVAPLKYNIEIKSLATEYNVYQPEVPEFSDLVQAVVFAYLPPERVCIQSFDFNVLKFWNVQIGAGVYPKCDLSALIEPDENNDVDFQLTQLGFLPDIWSPYFKKLDEPMVKTLHERGIRVIPWTVNAPNDMHWVRQIGCDGLITDYPNRAKTGQE